MFESAFYLVVRGLIETIIKSKNIIHFFRHDYENENNFLLLNPVGNFS
jgi:hypothetical protein